MLRPVTTAAVNLLLRKNEQDDIEQESSQWR
jgi:hypothetical protein